MDVVLDKSTLARVLSRVTGAIGRSSIQILTNVAVIANKTGLTLIGTDMDLTAEAIVSTESVQILREGATTVPASVLSDIVRRLPDGAQVSMTLDENDSAGRLIVRAGRSRFMLATLPFSDFPPPPVPADGPTFHVPTADLRRLIDRSLFAASTEETRYYLNGIYIQSRDDFIVFAATDGHRLAEASCPMDVPDFTPVILPRQSAALLRKLIDQGAAAQITVNATPTRWTFGMGDFSLTTKLIDGTFPEYERIMPLQNPIRVSASVPALSAAIDRVAAIVDAKSRGVKVAIAPETVLTAADGDGSTATESLSPDEFTQISPGPDFEIGFNARYLSDLLTATGGARVEIALADPAAPILLTPPGDEIGFRFVLMPMRL